MSEIYQEINLANYIKVIKRRWKVIIILTLIIMLLTAGYYSLKTPVFLYEAEAIIQIGQVNRELIDTKALVESSIITRYNAANILKQIDGDQKITKSRINQLLKTTLLDDVIGLPENFILISYQDEIPERAIQIITAWQNSFLERQKQLFTTKTKERDIWLEQQEGERKKLEKQLVWTEKFLSDFANVNYPASYIAGQGIAVQPYVGLFNSLRTEATSLEETALRTNLAKNMDQASKLISPPTITSGPIRKNESVNLPVTLSLAGFLGLFIGVISAFGLEWWEQNKADLD